MTKTEKKIFKKIYEYLLEIQKDTKNEWCFPVGICSIFSLIDKYNLRYNKGLKFVSQIPEFAAFAPKEKRDTVDWQDKKYKYPSTGSFWWEWPMNNRKLAIEERLTAVAFILTMPEDLVPELTKQKKTKKKKK